jgi:hypothetical protein
VFFSSGPFSGTLPRTKPDDTAAERRSISTFQKCVGDQCNSQGCDGVAPRIARAHLRSHRRRSGICLRNRSLLWRVFQIGANGGVGTPSVTARSIAMLHLTRLGSAPRSGCRGRRFKSCHSDQHLDQNENGSANTSANPTRNECGTSARRPSVCRF